jgi:RNA polymerase sigma factor (sigma-70 family)
MGDTTTLHRRIEALWRMDSARLIATLARQFRNLDLAEELAQDALVTALERWPQAGIPDQPYGWWLTTARNRAIDRIRQRQLAERVQDQIETTMAPAAEPPPHALPPADEEVGDDLLKLLFVACHPVLPREAQVALTLRLLGGLTTTEIARAFLTPEPTIAQRIVRAKRMLAERAGAFEVPGPADRLERLDAVLSVVYLVFNEGYTATAGEDWMRPALCDEALRLARILAAQLPNEAEVLGLLALLELQASRTAARTTPDGTPILLADQNRARWDQLLIRRGLAVLDRAGRLGGLPGPYQLQAQIAACHARARRVEDTDWTRIATGYALLAQIAPSPIVTLNRAVALAMADGPAVGLRLLETIVDEPQLQTYHLLPAVRGDLLARLGRQVEAAAAFEAAAALTANLREQQVLAQRAAQARRDA